MALPYSSARTGTAALAEAEKILRKFGCSNFGTMNDWDKGMLICQFTWRDRQVQIHASWRGYAEAWLKENPWTRRRHHSKTDWELIAKEKGEIAVPSILRDWIKGQVTAVEIGLMPFEHAFLPHMLMADGRPLIEHAVKLLELPDQREDG